MGIITLALFTGTKAGSFDELTAAVLTFCRTRNFLCRLGKSSLRSTMAAGTAAGGWRIIRTLGHRMVKLQPVHGFAAETTRRNDHSGRELLRHSALHDPRDLNVNHGRRRGETFQRNEMDGGRTNRLGLDLHIPARGLIGYLLERTLSAL